LFNARSIDPIGQNLLIGEERLERDSSSAPSDVAAVRLLVAKSAAIKAQTCILGTLMRTVFATVRRPYPFLFKAVLCGRAGKSPLRNLTRVNLRSGLRFNIAINLFCSTCAMRAGAWQVRYAPVDRRGRNTNCGNSLGGLGSSGLHGRRRRGMH